MADDKPEKKTIRDLKKEPKIKLDLKRLFKAEMQYSQKCPGCYKYLMGWDKITTYTGDNDQFYGWIIHEDCIDLV